VVQCHVARFDSAMQAGCQGSRRVRHATHTGERLSTLRLDRKSVVAITQNCHTHNPNQTTPTLCPQIRYDTCQVSEQLRYFRQRLPCCPRGLTCWILGLCIGLTTLVNLIMTKLHAPRSSSARALEGAS